MTQPTPKNIICNIIKLLKIEVRIIKEKKLKEFITFSLGYNQSRIARDNEGQNIIYYDQAAFAEDIEALVVHEDVIKRDTVNSLGLHEGQVVINRLNNQATMISENNVGKVLTSNFICVEFNNSDLDKTYFMYLFNAYKKVQRQKEKMSQGISAVQSISLADLGEIEIPYVNIAEQRLIGNTYMKMLELERVLSKQINLIDRLSLTLLDNIVEKHSK